MTACSLSSSMNCSSPGFSPRKSNSTALISCCSRSFSRYVVTFIKVPSCSTLLCSANFIYQLSDIIVHPLLPLLHALPLADLVNLFFHSVFRLLYLLEGQLGSLNNQTWLGLKGLIHIWCGSRWRLRGLWSSTLGCELCLLDVVFVELIHPRDIEAAPRSQNLSAAVLHD
jgi:hypothetical protein